MQGGVPPMYCRVLLQKARKQTVATGLVFFKTKLIGNQTKRLSCKQQGSGRGGQLRGRTLWSGNTGHLVTTSLSFAVPVVEEWGGFIVLPQ